MLESLRLYCLRLSLPMLRACTTLHAEQYSCTDLASCILPALHCKWVELRALGLTCVSSKVSRKGAGRFTATVSYRSYGCHVNRPNCTPGSCQHALNGQNSVQVCALHCIPTYPAIHTTPSTAGISLHACGTRAKLPQQTHNPPTAMTWALEPFPNYRQAACTQVAAHPAL